MRNIIYELEFIHDSLQKRAPIAALGGIVVIALGLIFGKLAMVVAGALVTLLVFVDFVVARLFGNRNSN